MTAMVSSVQKTERNKIGEEANPRNMCPFPHNATSELSATTFGNA
jgi:hypothetical protein